MPFINKNYLTQLLCTISDVTLHFLVTSHFNSRARTLYSDFINECQFVNIYEILFLISFLFCIFMYFCDVFSCSWNVCLSIILLYSNFRINLALIIINSFHDYEDCGYVTMFQLREWGLYYCEDAHVCACW